MKKLISDMHKNELDQKLFEKSKIFFDKRFSTCNFAIKKAYQKRYSFVLSCMEIKPSDNIVDVGCAQGGMLLACKETNAKLYGVDFSYNALKIAKKSGLNNLVCADAQKIPFHNNIFDKIIVLQTIEVLQDKTSALDEIIRIAKADATFYFEVRNGSFVFSRLSKFIRIFFTRFAKEIKPELLFSEDPSYDEWMEMLHKHRYSIVKSLKTPVYLCYENPVQFLKTIIIKIVYFLCPAKYCFTLSFLCKKRF